MSDSKSPSNHRSRLKSVQSFISANEKKLHSFTDIQTAPQSTAWITIADLYQSRRFRDNLLATLLNGALSSALFEFLLSRSIAVQYLIDDPNATRKTIDGTSMSRALASLTGSKVLCCLDRPSKFGDQKKKAGTYRFTPEFFQLLELDIPATHPRNSSIESEYVSERVLVHVSESEDVSEFVSESHQKQRERAVPRTDLKPNDLVRCINSADGAEKYLTEGKIYRIKYVHHGHMIHLEGILTAFGSARFERVEANDDEDEVTF